MERTNKKGAFRRFLDWLNTQDEEELENGEINIKAFKDEDQKIMQELKNTSKKVNNMGNGMFMSREQHRKETLKNMHANVGTPKVEQVKSKEQEEKERE